MGKGRLKKKKPLVDDVVAEVSDAETIVTEPKKEDDKSTDEQTGNIGLAPYFSLDAFKASLISYTS